MAETVPARGSTPARRSRTRIHTGEGRSKADRLRSASAPDACRIHCRWRACVTVVVVVWVTALSVLVVVVVIAGGVVVTIVLVVVVVPV